MRRSLDILVIGATGVDTNVYLNGREIDFTVEANFTENIDYVGQAGGYASRGFARLGKRVGLIDYVGDDYCGRLIRDELSADGIDLEGLFIDPSGTRRSVNFMSSDGRRKNFYDGKGAMQIRPDTEACRHLLARAPLAHFNIVNWCRYLLPAAKELGLRISCDIQDVVSIDDPYRKEFVEYADVLFFSAVNQTDPEAAMKRFHDVAGGRIVIASRGKDGCGVCTSAGIQFFEPFSFDQPVIDTNGAGDALAVGFLSSYFMDGFSLADSILRGQIAARYTCTVKGSSSLLITRAQLEDLFVMAKGKR